MKTVSVNPKNKLGHKSEHGYIEGYSYDNREEDLPDERSTCDDQDGEPPGKTAVIRHRFFFVGQQKAVRAVIISGGDPSALSTHRLESLITRKRKIKYAAAIRTGTRFPLMLPQRIDIEGMRGQKSGLDELALRNYERRIFHYRKPAKLSCMSSPPRLCVQPIERLRAYLNNRVPFRVRRSSKCG